MRAGGAATFSSPGCGRLGGLESGVPVGSRPRAGFRGRVGYGPRGRWDAGHTPAARSDTGGSAASPPRRHDRSAAAPRSRTVAERAVGRSVSRPREAGLLVAVHSAQALILMLHRPMAAIPGQQLWRTRLGGRDRGAAVDGFPTGLGGPDRAPFALDAEDLLEMRMVDGTRGRGQCPDMAPFDPAMGRFLGIGVAARGQLVPIQTGEHGVGLSGVGLDRHPVVGSMGLDDQPGGIADRVQGIHGDHPTVQGDQFQDDPDGRDRAVPVVEAEARQRQGRTRGRPESRSRCDRARCGSRHCGRETAFAPPPAQIRRCPPRHAAPVSSA